MWDSDHEYGLDLALAEGSSLLGVAREESVLGSVNAAEGTAAMEGIGGEEGWVEGLGGDGDALIHYAMPASQPLEVLKLKSLMQLFMDQREVTSSQGCVHPRMPAVIICGCCATSKLSSFFQ